MICNTSYSIYFYIMLNLLLYLFINNTKMSKWGFCNGFTIKMALGVPTLDDGLAYSK